MNNPPSQPSVSVEETENGYIVRAGSAVANISKNLVGYAVDANSQVLKEEYNLSPGVEKVRKSAHDAGQFSVDPTDDTRLILNTARSFIVLSQAVEMVCGCRLAGFPTEYEWKLCSSWESGPQNQAKPEPAQPISKQSEKQTESASTLAALRIHQEVSKLPRYHFDKSTEIAVEDGLLIVFEDGEKYGDDERIVYVGINQKSGRLPGRIHDIVGGHKDGAVLRKYIGEAFLRKDGHPYARIWAKDSSSPEGRRKIGTFYDQKKQDETEVRVTAYLKEHMSFSVIEIPNATRRKLLQDELVQTLKEAYSQSPVSNTWLGKYHSDLKIRTAALWMVGNERARPFNKEEVETFLKEIQNSQSLESVAKSTSSTSETISEVPSPVEQTSEENNAYSVNEEPTLDDVLQMENTDEKERILLKVVKHHLRELGVAGPRVLVLSPLLLYPGVPKSKISISFGPGYARTAISTNIDNLIAEKVITKYQFQRIGRKRVTYYKFTDVEKFISDLDTQKEEKLRVVSTSLETVIKSLEEEYHLSEEDYISHNSAKYREIQEKLINPIILLGLTRDAAQLLVYLHLFKEVTEEKVHDLLCQLTHERKINLLRKFFSANWIGTNGDQRKENGKWVITQLYHLAQPLEDILLNYALNYGEGLNNSIMELRKIIAYLAEHPLTILEGSVTRSYDEEEDEEKSDENAEFRSFSWKVNPEISAVKTLDKSAFQYHNSGVPKAVCPFFGVDKLPRGGKKTIYLNYLSKRFTGYLVRDFGGSHSVKIYWDKDFANILSEYRAINGDELSLAFIKMSETDTYNLKVAKIGNSEEEITPVPVDTRREERKVESPKPQYSPKTQILPEKKVEEIVETEIQKSVYKYSTLVGNIDNWKNLYLTVKPYRAATIKDMGADFLLYNVSDSRNRILLGNELTSIINIEGPISRQQLIQRVMDLHSIPRLGEKIEGNILYSLRVLVNQGRIQRSKDAEQEYYSSKLNPILPRKRNYVLNISVSEISPDEIRVMIISHLLNENRCMKNTLIRDVYRGLGYQSQINHDISRRIERVLHDMISDGIIKIENQKVSFVTE